MGPNYRVLLAGLIMSVKILPSPGNTVSLEIAVWNSGKARSAFAASSDGIATAIDYDYGDDSFTTRADKLPIGPSNSLPPEWLEPFQKVARHLRSFDVRLERDPAPGVNNRKLAAFLAAASYAAAIESAGSDHDLPPLSLGSSVARWAENRRARAIDGAYIQLAGLAQAVDLHAKSLPTAMEQLGDDTAINGAVLSWLFEKLAILATRLVNDDAGAIAALGHDVRAEHTEALQYLRYFRTTPGLTVEQFFAYVGQGATPNSKCSLS